MQTKKFTPWPQETARYYRQQGLWQGQPLSDLLDNAATQYPQHIALIQGEQTLNYQALQQRVMQLVNGFHSLGLQAGDKIVVHLGNVIAYYEVIFALFRLGAIPVMALAAHRQHELIHFCQVSQAKTLITAPYNNSDDVEELALSIKNKTPVEQVIVDSTETKFMALSECYQTTDVQTPKPNASNIALLQLSGGTTSIPKLIPRTHDDYFYSIRQSVEVCELTTDTVLMITLPAAHNFPLSSPGALGALYAGATVVLAKNSAPDEVFPLIERHQVTTVALVPPLAIAWLNAIKQTSHNLSSLQLIQVGGAKFSEQLAKQIPSHFDCQLQQVFGMAEGLVNYTRLNDSAENIFLTQGCPMSSYDEVRIVDDNDQDLPPGEMGHLLTRGPYTIRGYYAAPEYNKKAFTTDGFYRTGDLVRATKDGYLIVDGRAKDQINRGGEKISSEEIENILLSAPNILNVALVALPDDVLGEKSCACIIPRCENDLPQTKQLRRLLREQKLADYKIPDQFIYLSEFPMTKFGKVNKQALRKSLLKA